MKDVWRVECDPIATLIFPGLEDTIQSTGECEDGDGCDGKDSEKVCHRPLSPTYCRYVHCPINWGGEVVRDGIIGEATHNHIPGAKELPSDAKSI